MLRIASPPVLPHADRQLGVIVIHAGGGIYRVLREVNDEIVLRRISGLRHAHTN
jgi:hypothetical protein